MTRRSAWRLARGSATFRCSAKRKAGSTPRSPPRFRAARRRSHSSPRSASVKCGSSMADAPRNRSALVTGVFFVVAGIVFLLEALDVWDLSLRVLGPVLLITLGVAVVLGGRTRQPPS